MSLLTMAVEGSEAVEVLWLPVTEGSGTPPPSGELADTLASSSNALKPLPTDLLDVMVALPPIPLPAVLEFEVCVAVALR